MTLAFWPVDVNHVSTKGIEIGGGVRLWLSNTNTVGSSNPNINVRGGSTTVVRCGRGVPLLSGENAPSGRSRVSRFGAVNERAQSSGEDCARRLELMRRISD